MLQVNNLIGFGAGEVDAIPYIADVVTSEDNVADSNHVFTISSYRAGDLCIVLGVNGSIYAVSHTLSGWTELTDTASTVINCYAYAKIMTGAEGSTATIVSSSSGRSSFICLTIRNAYSSVSGVAAASQAVGTRSNPDPPNLTPTWATAQTLWLAVSFRNAATSTPTSFPSGFTLSRTTRNHSGGASASLSVAGQSLQAASNDPGAYAYAASEDSGAMTIAIRPV